MFLQVLISRNVLNNITLISAIKTSERSFSLITTISVSGVLLKPTRTTGGWRGAGGGVTPLKVGIYHPKEYGF